MISRIDFGIREDFAGRVDDGCPCARRLSRLGGNVSQGVQAIGLHALGEHQRLLLEVALDLLAESSFPEFCGW